MKLNELTQDISLTLNEQADALELLESMRQAWFDIYDEASILSSEKRFAAFQLNKLDAFFNGLTY
jgi:hypothetical protein